MTRGVCTLGFRSVLNVKYLHYYVGFGSIVYFSVVAAEFAVAAQVLDGVGCIVVIDEFPTDVAEDGLAVGCFW